MQCDDYDDDDTHTRCMRPAQGTPMSKKKKKGTGKIMVKMVKSAKWAKRVKKGETRVKRVKRAKKRGMILKKVLEKKVYS